MNRRLHTQLPDSPLAASEAREFLRAALQTWALDGFGEMTELLASELVSNAVTHGRGPITMHVEADADTIRVEVVDHAQAQPVLLSVSEEIDHGRGILIIDRLADRWGSEPAGNDGKIVWFEIDVATATEEIHGQEPPSD